MSKERKDNISFIQKDVLLDIFSQLTGMEIDGKGESNPSGIAKRINLIGTIIFGSATKTDMCHDLDVIFVSTMNTGEYHLDFSEFLKADFDLELTRRLRKPNYGRLDNGLGFLEPAYVDNMFANEQHSVIKNTDNLVVFAFNSIGDTQIKELIEEIKNS